MSEDRNLLEHTFHDSYLKGVEKEENQTRLVIDTDIYLHPGKPFTILTLENVENPNRAKKLLKQNKGTSLSIDSAEITRSDKNGKNFKLDMKFHSGKGLELHFYNFWTERVENYKDYSNRVFR